MSATLGRRLTNVAQRSKGRQALRFQLELIPYFLDQVPPSVKRASFMWERGAKLQYTEPSPVDAGERTVVWGNTLLKQTATMYKEGDVILAKEYHFKVQSVSSGGREEKRATFARTKIDLAKYCSCDSSEAREVFIPLQPAGTLRISIQATWLRHSQPENDTMTEISAMSLGRSGTSSLEEQDLSGFDSQQSRIYGLRQAQALDSPFGPPRPGPPSPEGGPLARGQAARGGRPPPGGAGSRRKGGFQNVDLHEEDRPGRAAGRPPLPGKAGGTPASASSADFRTPPGGGPSADPDKILNESYAALISSDEDEEGGVVKSAKRWFATGSKKDSGYPSSTLGPHSSAGSTAGAGAAVAEQELQTLNLEDTTQLRRLAKAALRQRDQEQLLRQQAERRARHLQSDCEALAMSKSMLVERLREAEDRLLSMRQEETMNALVQAKIKLAQADYANLELQGHLSAERERTRVLKLRLTDLEAAYHATLDSLDRLALADAPGTPERSTSASATVARLWAGR